MSAQQKHAVFKTVDGQTFKRAIGDVASDGLAEILAEIESASRGGEWLWFDGTLVAKSAIVSVHVGTAGGPQYLPVE